MKIYTRTGDAGQTSLVGGTRISKTSIHLEAYGTIDELNANIGLAIEELIISEIPTERKQLRNDLIDELGRVQGYLFTIGGILATESENRVKYWGNHPVSEWTMELEKIIDAYSEILPKLESFVLPRGSKSAALLHIARTVARRAERNIYRMEELIPQNDLLFEEVKKIANRISDFLFIAARLALYLENKAEIHWKSEK